MWRLHSKIDAMGRKNALVNFTLNKALKSPPEAQDP